MAIARRLALAVPLILLAAIYGPTLGFPPLSWDDETHIFNNGHLLAGDVGYFWRTPHFGLYIPLTYTFWTWIYHGMATLGLAPVAGLRLVHLGLHGINGVLLHRLAERYGVSRLWAAVLALLFLVHPLQVGTVAWISGGRDLLAAALGLAALILCLRLDAWSQVAMALLLFAGSFLAKPSTVGLPVVAWILARERGPRLKTTVVVSLGLGLVLVALAREQQGGGALDELAPLAWRLPVACDALIFYLRKMVIPVSLGADYGRTPAAVMSQGLWPISVAICGLSLILLRSRWRDQSVKSMGILLAILLPVLGLVPFGFQKVSTVADHYAYLLWLAWIPWLRTIKDRRVVLGFVAALLYGGIAARPADYWSTPERFYQRMLDVNPQSFNGAVNLGVDLMKPPASAPRAEAAFRQALEMEPGHTLPLYYMSRILLGERRYGELVELIEPWSLRGSAPETVGYRPDPAYDRHLWSWIEMHLALAYHRRGEPHAADRAIARALAYDRNNCRVYDHYGRILIERGQNEAAQAQWTEARRLEAEARD